MRMYVTDPGHTTFQNWAWIERAGQSCTTAATGGATTIWADFPKKRRMGCRSSMPNSPDVTRRMARSQPSYQSQYIYMSAALLSWLPLQPS